MTDVHNYMNSRTDIKWQGPRANPLPTNDVVYADNTYLLTTKLKYMQIFMNTIETRAAEGGMKFNKTKCKLMHVHHWSKFQTEETVKTLDGHPLELKESHLYLDLLVTRNADPDKHIRYRCNLARRQAQKLKLL